MANEDNGRICISWQEHKGKENSVSCTVLPGKWSHDDHKTWLDCSKTIHKAGLGIAKGSSVGQRESRWKPCCQFCPHSHSEKPAWCCGSLGEGWEEVAIGGAPGVAVPLHVMHCDGEGSELCPCTNAFSSLPVVGLQTAKCISTLSLEALSQILLLPPNK